jgi:SAM-dependent methyltransferase
LVLMNSDDAWLLTDRSYLQPGQYRTDANLAARQSLFDFQHPPVDLPAVVLDLAHARGDETVADIGCGNGGYLAELARRGHAGRVLGVDLSVGMLAASRRRAQAAGLAAGDAAALPRRDHAAGLTVAAHMLYHVPDPRLAVRELRRVTRPGGAVLVVLNGHDHMRELRDLMAATLKDATGQPPPAPRLRLDAGQDLLASQFTSVIRHDFISELRVPGPEPVKNYVRSMISAQVQPDPDAVAIAVASRLCDWPFKVHSHSGCLICT